jgi:hypothetical protein
MKQKAGAAAPLRLRRSGRFLWPRFAKDDLRAFERTSFEIQAQAFSFLPVRPGRANLGPEDVACVIFRDAVDAVSGKLRRCGFGFVFLAHDIFLSMFEATTLAASMRFVRMRE